MILTIILIYSIKLLTDKIQVEFEKYKLSIKDKTKEQDILLSKYKDKSQIIEQIHDCVISTDLDGNITSWNNGSKILLGYTEEEMLNKHITTIYREKDYELLGKNIEILKKDGECDVKVHLVKKSKKLLFVELSLSLLKDNDGVPVGMIGYSKDITDKNKLESLLNEQSKMAAMGEMIGNIAHQWRQPLSVISTASTGMQLQKEYNLLSDEEFNKNCELINDNAQYLSETIDDFRNFIKGDRTKMIFSLKDEINSFLSLVDGSVKNNNINIVLDLEESIKIDGYKNELTQCLINIFNNAKDVLREREVQDKFIFITTTKSTNKVTIKIKDNAGGISKDIINRVFEPYFTTKHKSQGTGLGLHMTYNLIVDGMNGTIEANNVEFQPEHSSVIYVGAEFLITLPIS